MTDAVTASPDVPSFVRTEVTAPSASSARSTRPAQRDEQCDGRSSSSTRCASSTPTPMSGASCGVPRGARSRRTRRERARQPSPRAERLPLHPPGPRRDARDTRAIEWPIVLRDPGLVHRRLVQRTLLCDLGMAVDDASFACPSCGTGSSPIPGARLACSRCAATASSPSSSSPDAVMDAEEAFRALAWCRLRRSRRASTTAPRSRSRPALLPPARVRAWRQNMNDIATPLVTKSLHDELVQQMLAYKSDDFAEFKRARAESRARTIAPPDPGSVVSRARCARSKSYFPCCSSRPSVASSANASGSRPTRSRRPSSISSRRAWSSSRSRTIELARVTSGGWSPFRSACSPSTRSSPGCGRARAIPIARTRATDSARGLRRQPGQHGPADGASWRSAKPACRSRWSCS